LIDPNTADPDFATTWMGAGYSGSGFTDSAPAMLGYGTIDFSPVQSDIGQPDSGKRGTAYFRHAFNTTGANTGLGLEVLMDDGGVIYLDGEVLKANNHSNPDAFGSFTDGVGDEWGTETFYDLGSLSAGSHLLAVSMHQNQAGSSDMGFDLRMFAAVPEPSTTLLIALGGFPLLTVLRRRRATRRRQT